MVQKEKPGGLLSAAGFRWSWKTFVNGGHIGGQFEFVWTGVGFCFYSNGEGDWEEIVVRIQEGKACLANRNSEGREIARVTLR